jgi:acetyltransferase-like isoleucine patch superfamily enzyme
MKEWFKAALDGLAWVCVLPVLVGYTLAAWIVGRDRAFPGWSQSMSLFPGLLGTYLRRAFYRSTLSECGSGSWITFGTIFARPTVRIGRNSYVGAYCVIADATIEEDVLIGSHVSIMSGPNTHGTGRLDLPVREQPGVIQHLTIGRDTWIGDRASILADVGRHCVIGAGSVVTRPIPDFAIAVGCPARIVGDRRERAIEEPDHPES